MHRLLKREKRPQSPIDHTSRCGTAVEALRVAGLGQKPGSILHYQDEAVTPAAFAPIAGEVQPWGIAREMLTRSKAKEHEAREAEEGESRRGRRQLPLSRVAVGIRAGLSAARSRSRRSRSRGPNQRVDPATSASPKVSRFPHDSTNSWSKAYGRQDTASTYGMKEDCPYSSSEEDEGDEEPSTCHDSQAQGGKWVRSFSDATSSNCTGIVTGPGCLVAPRVKTPRGSASGQSTPRGVRGLKQRTMWRSMATLMLLSISVLCLVFTSGGGGHLGSGEISTQVVTELLNECDSDQDGNMNVDDIRRVVEAMGGINLDEISEVNAAIASVFRHIDKDADQALSHKDLLSYWKRLGKLLNVEEAADWVKHAAQLDDSVAAAFRHNLVTGYDFPELVAGGLTAIERELGIEKPAFQKRLLRSMKWRLWGVGEEPGPPVNLRVMGSGGNSISIAWDAPDDESGFLAHKYVLKRRKVPKLGSKSSGQTHNWSWVTDKSRLAHVDTGLDPVTTYEYSLVAWNAIGHSEAITVQGTTTANSGEGDESSWLMDLCVTLLVLAGAAAWFHSVIRAPRGSEEALASKGSTSESVQQLKTVNSSGSTASGDNPSRTNSASLYSNGEATGSSESLPSAELNEGLSTSEARNALAQAKGAVDSASSRTLVTRRVASQGDELRQCNVCDEKIKARSRRHICSSCHQHFHHKCGKSTHWFFVCPVSSCCICNDCLQKYGDAPVSNANSPLPAQKRLGAGAGAVTRSKAPITRAKTLR
ncbi:unnamed protein product [Chrysoparadoxa australica]